MAKKRTGKRATAKKRAGTRTASTRRSKTARRASHSKKRTARAGSARGPLNRVRAAGKKTWKALKSTTAHVVEGVKGTFGSDSSSDDR